MKKYFGGSRTALPDLSLFLTCLFLLKIEQVNKEQINLKTFAGQEGQFFSRFFIFKVLLLIHINYLKSASARWF